MDLIDRRELGLGFAKPEAFIKPEYAYGWNSAIEVINAVPTVEAVEVVRCKDCTEWDKNERECSHWYGFRENDFCSYGERRDSNAADAYAFEPVKHGRWLPQVLLGERVWDCSECKTLGSPHWRRCPNCGAKMDLEETE